MTAVVAAVGEELGGELIRLLVHSVHAQTDLSIFPVNSFNSFITLFFGSLLCFFVRVSELYSKLCILCKLATSGTDVFSLGVKESKTSL